MKRLKQETNFACAETLVASRGPPCYNIKHTDDWFHFLAATA